MGGSTFRLLVGYLFSKDLARHSAAKSGPICSVPVRWDALRMGKRSESLKFPGPRHD